MPGNRTRSTWGLAALLAATFGARRTALGCGTSRSSASRMPPAIGGALRSSSRIKAEVMGPDWSPFAARASKVWLAGTACARRSWRVLTSGALLLDQA